MRKLVIASLMAVGALGAMQGMGGAIAAQTPAQKDWATVYSTSPAGGFVIGNPAAKVKLVEYLSLTCPHCAHFAETGWGPLKAGFIRSGKVSLEVRNAVRDRYDLVASLLARCDGPRASFARNEALFARQDAWLARAASFDQSEEGGKLTEMNHQEAMTAMANGVGLDELLAPHGLPPARIKACLGNKIEQKKIAAMTEEAWEKRKIPGTPAFLINGVLQENVSGWDALEPKIRAALR
jgi:protein-disulfide isomerase